MKGLDRFGRFKSDTNIIVVKDQSPRGTLKSFTSSDLNTFIHEYIGTVIRLSGLMLRKK